jgi:hypothetical protein
MNGSDGDTTITVTGNAQWKETITVKKNSKGHTDHEAIVTDNESYFTEVRVKQNIST